MDVRAMIEQARDATARAVNAALVLLYWSIGDRIRRDLLAEARAEYEIISTLSRQLVADFGNGYSRPNLFRMIRFAEVFPDQQIVAALSRQLGWSHFVEIIIRVATYLTELPPRALLQKKLRSAAQLARQRWKEVAG